MSEAIGVTHVMALDELPEGSPFSGAENHLFSLMPAQVRLGLRVRFVMLVVRGGPRLDAKAVELQALGIDVIKLQLPSSLLPGKIGKVVCYAIAVRLLEGILRDGPNQLVHTHLDTADIIGKIAAARAQRTVVSSVHNNEPYYQTFIWRRVLRFLDRYTAHYIAISNVVRDQILEVIGISGDKVTTIYYGIDPPLPLCGAHEIRTTLAIPLDRFVVGFVGRFVEQKNLPVLIEAMARVPHIHAALLGAGPLEERIRRLVQSKGLRNVQFIGHRPDAARLMCGFDVLCLPSRWEGLGLVLLEAMMQGVPVIGSRAGAISEIMQDGDLGLLFDPGNADELAAVISQASTERDEVRTIAEKARARAREKYTVKSMVEQTIAIYRLAIGDASEHTRD